MTREKDAHVGSWLSSYQRKNCVLDTFPPPHFMKVTLLCLCLLCLEICGKKIFGHNPPAGDSESKLVALRYFVKKKKIKTFWKSTAKPLCQSLFFKPITGYSPGSFWWIVKLKWKRSGRDITIQTEPRFIFILLSLIRYDKTVLEENCLTHFMLMPYFYAWKRQKTKGFFDDFRWYRNKTLR